MTIDSIEKLKEYGIYKKLLRSGVIPIVIDSRYNIYKEYNIRLKENEGRRDQIMQTVTDVSNAFGVSESTVIRSVKFMTS